MRFAFTTDQLEFRDGLRALLEKECTAAHVRDAWTNATGRVPGLWERLVELGVTSVLTPESNGGFGLSFVDLVLLLEETGRYAVPEPVVETAAFWGPSLARPDEVVAAAHELVPWADGAAVLVTTRGVHDPNRVTLTPRPSVDGARRLFAVDGPAETVDLADAFTRGVLGFAAQQCGLADRMVELTVDYVKQREQFGVPIGSFQAVKHHLANARLALEFARPLVYRAAATLEPVHVSMAKTKADDAALLCGRVALQCHGAIGYTTEYDLHLYLKRAWALARSWGDARFHRNRVAKAIL
jgi:alkylation response protein AidB-like acyl-CoA dehydrogenase